MDPQRLRHFRSYEALQTPFSPAQAQTYGLQRSDMNFLQPTVQPSQQIQDDQMVSITNLGQTPQHYLQVAQQHCTAPPGVLVQHHQNPPPQQYGAIQLSEQDYRHLQHQQLDAQMDMIMRNNAQDHAVVKIERSRSNPIPQIEFLQPGQKIDRPSSALSVRHAVVDDKRSLHPNWLMQPQRPLTPPNHNGLSYFPVTPEATPASAGQSSTLQQQQQQQEQQQQLDIFPTHFDPNATIKGRPSFSRGFSQYDMFGPVPSSYISQPLPSPPNTVPLPSARHFDVAAVPAGPIVDMDFMDECVSPASSPVIRYHPLPMGYPTQLVDGPCSSPIRDSSPQLGDLHLDATIEDTGISAEEVQSFISEHDMDSGKWTCLFPECGKQFGRKENIRSHVQTHLGDRQYKCLHCEKRFVRQHDLKRHAKIHSGVKPYPCRCGNSFARHDALTRHRQRGICDGGFEGVVKKVVKRGRPRKARPDGDNRASKSSQTRKRAANKHYASSVSGTSESSCVDSPPSMFVDAYELATMQTILQSFTPPPSSPYSTGETPSPSKAFSTQGRSTETTPECEEEEQVTVLGAEASYGSPFGSLPELSHSSPPLSARPRELELDDIFRRSGTTNSEQTMTDPSASINTADFDTMTAPDPWNDFFNKDSDELRLENYGNSMMEEDSLFGPSANNGFF